MIQHPASIKQSVTSTDTSVVVESVHRKYDTCWPGLLLSYLQRLSKKTLPLLELNLAKRSEE